MEPSSPGAYDQPIISSAVMITFLDPTSRGSETAYLEPTLGQIRAEIVKVRWVGVGRDEEGDGGAGVGRVDLDCRGAGRDRVEGGVSSVDVIVIVGGDEWCMMQGDARLDGRST